MKSEKIAMKTLFQKIQNCLAQLFFLLFFLSISNSIFAEDIKLNFKWYEKLILYPILVPYYAVKDGLESISKKGEMTEIHRLCTGKGNEAKIKALLQKGNSINILNKFGQTPMHTAALNNRFEYIPLLLHLGADPKIKDDDQASVILYISGLRDPSILKLLLQKGADINEVSELKEETILHLYSEAGAVEMVRNTIELGGSNSLNKKDFQGNTPLHRSIGSMSVDKLEVTKLLVQKGADKNLKNKKGQTPLALAEENLSLSFLDPEITKKQIKFLKSN